MEMPILHNSHFGVLLLLKRCATPAATREKKQKNKKNNEKKKKAPTPGLAHEFQPFSRSMHLSIAVNLLLHGVQRETRRYVSY